MNFHQSIMELLLVRSIKKYSSNALLWMKLMLVSEVLVQLELALTIPKKKPMHVFALQNPQCDHQTGAMERKNLGQILSLKLRILRVVNNYWLRNHSRVHDAIVVKIDPVSEEDEPPIRMQAWHFCIRDKPGRNRDIPYRTYFEFGTHDEYGNPTNIQQGQCVIKISLSCLYHDTFTNFTIHRRLLPDPIILIILDFLKIRTQFLRMYRTR
ncbi:hypothetical protein Glove_283g90 [Diversispora epigaea]|uniref:Uncharacterized protein n=1 Tax=Diversispora epigaea TaxID=1348612 RepID=A0A397I2V1_9GLOM|nr:hypothetical protein Glove_283g90 [Diversispora epigaea]